jgi:hypothetical protein
MICEAMGEENALSDSGPLRRVPWSNILTCDVQACGLQLNLELYLAPSLMVAANLYRLGVPEQSLSD